MQINKVKEFNRAFNLITNETLTPNIGKDAYTLQYKLLEEENNEYLEACKNEDIVEIADALGDQLYIILGTILKHGLQDYIKVVFNEIHDSNMSKLDENKDPVVRADGKILKSNLYFKPNIHDILFKH